MWSDESFFALVRLVEQKYFCAHVTGEGKAVVRFLRAREVSQRWLKTACKFWTRHARPSCALILEISVESCYEIQHCLRINSFHS